MADIKVYKDKTTSYHVDTPVDIVDAKNKAKQLSKDKNDIHSVTVSALNGEYGRFIDGKLVNAEGHYFTELKHRQASS